MTDSETHHPVSRREFARRAAMVTAAAATALAVPQEIRAQATDGAAPAVEPALPPDVAAEVDAKLNEILRLHGPQFSAVQKQELRNQLIGQVKGLQKLRAYPIDNGDAPATVLRLRGTEGKP